MGKKTDFSQPTISLTEDEKLELRKTAKALADMADTAYFDLGDTLSKIARSGAFVEWGYKTFDAYIEAELDYKRRKAYYLMAIYEKATEFKIDASRLRKIGWAKAKEILRVAHTAVDFEAWVIKAEKLKLRELLNEIRVFNGLKPKGGTDADGNKILIDDTTGEEFHQIFFALSDDQYDNFRLAMERAALIAKSDKEGHCLDLMLLEFLANHTTIDNLNQKIADWVNKGIVEE